MFSHSLLARSALWPRTVIGMTDDDVDTILDSAMPCRKAPRIGHVTLIQNSAQEDTERGVFVGHRLRRGIAAQSGLLSGLSDADGLASLPDNLTPEDVRLWQLAKLVPTSPSTDELVTILTVRVPDLTCLRLQERCTSVCDVSGDSCNKCKTDKMPCRKLTHETALTVLLNSQQCRLLLLHGETVSGIS